MEERKYFPKYGIIGFFIIVFSEAGLILRLQFFEIFMTPLCWTGLILLADAWNYRLSGNSYIMNRRKEFFWMALWSIGLWYIFEFYNLYLRNWHYIGLPRSVWVRYFGFFWSFATIWPGVLEIHELVANYRLLGKVGIRPVRLSGGLLTASFVAGLAFVTIPFWVSPKAATYMAAPVWLGMIFLLDPLNFAWKQESLWRDLARGDLSRLLQLLLSGIIAGFLWEFWNYWAATKWIYTVPILGHIKIFEMPVIGYLGFPPFAVEIFVMWQTVRFILRLK